MPKSRDLISLFRQLDNDYAAILHKKLNQYAKQEGHPGIHAQSEREYDVVTTTVTFGEDPELPKLQIQFYDWGFSDVIVSKVTQHQQPDGTMEKSYELLDRFSHRNNTFEAGREMAEFVYDNTTKYVQSFMQSLDPEQMTPLELPKRPSVPEDQDYQTVCAVRTLAGIARLAAKNGLQIGDDIRVTSTIDDISEIHHYIGSDFEEDIYAGTRSRSRYMNNRRHKGLPQPSIEEAISDFQSAIKREYDLQRSWAAEEIADAIGLSDDDNLDL